MITTAPNSKTIKLFCPSLQKLVRFVAYDDHGLDLGTIARSFGLDPATLRLNGHFVSRGANLISSVTWKSLLSFFDSRGFSTGTDGHDAVIVDGKLFDGSDDRSIGAGRHSPSDYGNSDDSKLIEVGLGMKRKAQLEDVTFLKKIKMEHCNSGRHSPSDYGNGDDSKLTEVDGLGMKRKTWLEDVIFLKKRKMEHCNSGQHSPSDNGNRDDSKLAKDDGLGMKRKLRQEDMTFLKKRKMEHCNSGQLSNSSNPITSVT